MLSAEKQCCSQDAGKASTDLPELLEAFMTTSIPISPTVVGSFRQESQRQWHNSNYSSTLRFKFNRNVHQGSVLYFQL